MLLVGIPSPKAGVEWAADLSTTKSLFDYDAVVVNMFNVFDAGLIIAPSDVMEAKRLEAEKLLSKGGIIVCLAAPEIDKSFLSIRARSYDWIPVAGLGNIVLKGEGQRFTRVNSSAFNKYLELQGIVWYAYLEKSQRTNYQILAKNEGEFAIAARIQVGKGSIYFLPLSINTNWLNVIYECLDSAWKQRDDQRTPPKWVSEIIIPQQKEITDELAQIDSKIKTLAEKSRGLSKSLEERLGIRKLLYEQGPPLEDAVGAFFEEIGYKLQKKDDMDLVYEGLDRMIILEVTGSDGTIGLGKLRQLLDFMEKEKERAPKGILVGNHEIDVPVDKRGDPFTKHVIERADSAGVCLLPTTELFGAAVAFRQKKLDPAKFWASLIETAGIFNLKPAT